MTFVQPERDREIGAIVTESDGDKPFRGPYRRMSHRLLGLLKLKETRDEVREDRVHIGNLMRQLGEQSFGWGILLFALINLLPVPLGTNMFLAIPLLIIGVQMILGYEMVRLPAFLANKTVPRAGVKRTIARMRPVFRRLERLARERQTWILAPAYRPPLGAAVLVLAVALAAPIPTSGWGPAFSIFIIGFGMIERDGGIVVFGLSIGVVALCVVVAAVTIIALGIKTIAGMPV